MNTRMTRLAVLAASLALMAAATPAALMNAALGASYTATTPISESGFVYSEPAPHTEFTDGDSIFLFAETAGWTPGTPTAISVTLDLGSTVSDIVSVELDALVSVSSAVTNPTAVSVEVSTDNVTFSPGGSLAVTGFGDGPSSPDEAVNEWTLTLASPASARYVRFNIQWPGDPHKVLTEVSVWSIAPLPPVVNVALGKSYTATIPISESGFVYSEPAPHTEFTDGDSIFLFAETAGWTPGTATNIGLTVDLNSAVDNIAQVQLDALVSVSSAVTNPTAVSAEISSDGVVFTPIGSLADVATGDGPLAPNEVIHQWELTLATWIPARYVRFNIQWPGDPHKILTEVRVFAVPTTTAANDFALYR